MKHRNYQLNEPQVTAYLQKIAQCGPVTPAYLASLRAQFEGIRQLLAREPRDDGEIEGMDYDWVVHNMVPSDTQATLDTAQVMLRQERKTSRLYALRAAVPLVVKVVSTDKGWQIDSIGHI